MTPSRTKKASRPHRNIIKPAKKRPSAKLVEAARDHVLDAYDEAAELLTTKEQINLIATLRDDLELRQSEIEDTSEARRRKALPRPRPDKPGLLRIRNQGDRTIITLTGAHS